MTKTMTFGEMKMVNGGTLLDGLTKISGGKDSAKFYIGERVLYLPTDHAGTILGSRWNPFRQEEYYTVKFDHGGVYDDIPEYDLLPLWHQ